MVALRQVLRTRDWWQRTGGVGRNTKVVAKDNRFRHIFISQFGLKDNRYRINCTQFIL